MAKRDKTRYEDLRITADMADSEIEDMVRQRIQWRQRRWRRLFSGILPFIIINGLLWAIWSPTARYNSFPWPLFVTFFWGMSIVRTIWELYQSSERVQDRREELIQRHMERAKVRLGRYEKPKNDYAEKSKKRPVQIGSDGEIVPLEQLLSEDDQDTPRYQNNYRQ